MYTSLKAGDSGSLGTEWEVQNSRRNQLARKFGFDGSDGSGKLDFDSALILMGVDDDVVLDKMNYSILGLEKTYGGDLLNWTDSAWSNDSYDDRLFQGSKQDLYTNIDFEKGTYSVMDERMMTEALGMDWSGGKPYDVLQMKNNKIDFYDFVFSGTPDRGSSDGSQKNVVFALNELTSARWGINNYTIREVNTNLATGTSEGQDYETMLANDTVSIIMSTIPQWMTKEIQEALKEYKPDSAEYTKKFLELAFKLMDQEGYLQGNEILSAGEEYLKNH